MIATWRTSWSRTLLLIQVLYIVGLGLIALEVAAAFGVGVLYSQATGPSLWISLPMLALNTTAIYRRWPTYMRAGGDD